MRRSIIVVAFIAVGLFLASFSMSTAELVKEPIKKEFGL